MNPNKADEKKRRDDESNEKTKTAKSDTWTQNGLIVIQFIEIGFTIETIVY